MYWREGWGIVEEGVKGFMRGVTFFTVGRVDYVGIALQPSATP